jgi:predicted molibdopterin-dependent oxidoreductase YjgC
MFEFILNGKTAHAEEGETVLQVARHLGIQIPTLCDHPDLTPFGGCRLCVVDVKGARMPQAACTLLAENGMDVQTDSPRLYEGRRAVLRMLLSNYYEESVTQDSELMLWVEVFDLDAKALMTKTPNHPVVSDPTPFIRVDMN